MFSQSKKNSEPYQPFDKKKQKAHPAQSLKPSNGFIFMIGFGIGVN